MIISVEKLNELVDMGDELYDDGGSAYDILMAILANLGIKVGE